MSGFIRLYDMTLQGVAPKRTLYSATIPRGITAAPLGKRRSSPEAKNEPRHKVLEEHLVTASRYSNLV
jgi:hypothetical protein